MESIREIILNKTEKLPMTSRLKYLTEAIEKLAKESEPGKFILTTMHRANINNGAHTSANIIFFSINT